MANILKNNIRPGGSLVRNIKNGSTEVKYVKRGDGKLFYDIQHYSDYDSPSITFYYPNTTVAASGGSISPSAKSYSLSWRYVGYSGNSYEQSAISTGATVTYRIVSGTGASVDSSGKVTWESRGTDGDDNTRLAIVRMTVTINGMSNSKDATVTLAANPITNIAFGTPTGKSLSVGIIPASGGTISKGTVSGTVTLSVTYTYASTSKETILVTPTISSDSYSTAVSASSLGSSIKLKTKIGTLTYYYVCNGVTGSCSASVYQLANLVTAVGVNSNTFSYNNIGAGATSASPTSSHSPIFTFTSTSTSTTVPSSTYGSLSTSVSYRMNSTLNGFTACNADTGVLTATSRGTNYGSSTRSSAEVVKTLVYTWTPTTNYGSAVENTPVTKGATCTLAKNLIKSLVLLNPNGGSLTNPSTYTANLNSKTVSNSTSASCGCRVTFDSESYSDSYSTWVNLTTSYEWSSNLTYATLTSSNASSLSVTMTSRGSSHSTTTRSAVITRTATFRASLKSGYTNATTVSDSKSCTATVTLAANTVSIKSVTVSAGALTNPATYSAGESTKSVANKTSASASGVLVFASGSEVAASSTYGSWSGPSYSWSSNLTYATLTSANSASLNVTMTSRGKTIGNARSATITRTASYTFTLKSPYGSNSLDDSDYCTATCTQNGNYVTEITDISASNTSYTHTYYGSTAPATGGTTSITTNATCTYKFSSGSTAAYSNSSTPSGVSWTWVRTYANNGTATAGSSLNTLTGAVTWAENETSSARSTSVSVTLTATAVHSSTYSAGGSPYKTSTITITSKLSAGTKNWTAWSVSASANPTTVDAKGGTSTITRSAIRYYKWNGTPTATDNDGFENGTPTLSIKSAVTGASLSGTTLTWANNTTTSARSVIVVATHGGVSKEVTISLSKGSVKYIINDKKIDFPTSGGTQTISLVYDTFWNGVETSSDTTLTGYTLTYSSGSKRFTIDGTRARTDANTDTTSSYTAYYTISKSGYTSGTLTLWINKDKSKGFTYGTPTVSLSVSDIPANGGTVSSGTVTYSLTKVENFESGNTVAWANVTTGGTVTYTCKNTSGTVISSISGSDLKGNLKARTKLGTLTATVSINGKSGSASKDVYLALNLVESLAYTAASATSANHIYYNKYTLAASADTATATKNASCTATYSSGFKGTPSSGGTLNYSRTYNISGSGFSANSDSGNVSVTSKDTSISNSTTGSFSSKLTITWTPTSIGSIKTCISDVSYTFTQSANYVTGVTAYVTAFSYAQAEAIGGDISPTTGGRCNLTFTSGDTLTEVTSATSISGGKVTFSKEFLIAANSGTGATLNSTTTGLVHWPSRTNKLGDAWNTTVTYYITYTFTHNSSYNNGKAISDTSDASYAYPSQKANKVTAVSVKGYPGSVNPIEVEASGGAVDVPATGAWARATLTCTTNSTITTDYPSEAYGTWRFSHYSASSSDDDIATVGSSIYYNKVPITVYANTSTSSRSVVITRKEHGFTFTYNGTPYTSAATECGGTVTLKGTTVTKESIKINSFGYSFAFRGNSSSIGHVSYPQHGSITYTKTYSDGSTSTSTLSYSNCNNSYRLASSTHFMYYSGSPGALLVTSNNNSGAVRSTTAYWTATYNNTVLGLPISDTASCAVTQDFNHYYINIYNGSSQIREVYLCRYTASNPAGLGAIYIDARNTESIETTWGLSTSDGYTLTTSATVYVYVKDGNSLRSVGSISFLMNKNFEFSLDT